jgi:hypothetical protein
MGRQFANDVATPSPVPVKRDSFQNEIPGDPGEEHMNSTPEMGAFNWDAKHYADGWKGGNKPYGVTVTPPSGGTSEMVKGDAADRGKES